MNEVALPRYAAAAGNLGVLMLRRDLFDREWTEFTMISLWGALTDVEGFAGVPPARGVLDDRDGHFLVDREWQVRHHEVYGATAHLGFPAPATAGEGSTGHLPR
ncbi:MAG: antibiotic biosynthesis monooxygenase [Actinomycetes bacterium]